MNLLLAALAAILALWLLGNRASDLAGPSEAARPLRPRTRRRVRGPRAATEPGRRPSFSGRLTPPM